MFLGTDPEFVFIGPSGLVRADAYYPPQNNRRHDNPEIGGDGHPATVEIRTSPKESPVEVVGDIKRILSKHYLDLPENIAWRAGSYCEGKTLGGHIHFGGIGTQDSYITILDGILSQILTLLEDPTEAKQRRSTKYGSLSDFRTKPWGFEYRTLASWIVSPQISLGVLALAKACLYEELEVGPVSLAKLKGDRLRAVIDIDRMKFINVDKEHFMNKLDTLWEIISRYRYFLIEEGRPLWKNVCLLPYVAKNYQNWQTERDILHRWKVRDFTPDAYTKKFFDRKERIPREGVLDGARAVEILRGQG